MRIYSIKRGHKPDIDALVKKYFNAEGSTEEGMEFEAEGIGTVRIKKESNSIMIETIPSPDTQATYATLRKWNEFLFEATGRTAKERKKLWEKDAKKGS